MGEKRWVFIENLGTRVNWMTLKRKALEALGGATEAAIKGGRMDRARKAAVIEFAKSEEAEKVTETFDGYHDKVTSKGGDDVWKACCVTQEESSERMDKVAPSTCGNNAGARVRSASPAKRARSPSLAKRSSPLPRPPRSRSRTRSAPARRSPPRRSPPRRSRNRSRSAQRRRPARRSLSRSCGRGGGGTGGRSHSRGRGADRGVDRRRSRSRSKGGDRSRRR
mmetsp:Transcript_24610/g.69972  ORF Transcript_24610/g.69972 Transcript_24610/m.69972 type:complete len:223 (+) Transcript_24610:163-831(+)